MSRDPQTLIEPADEHNTKLVDNVHPLDWVNPEPAGRYHLVVIGAGTAGLVSAAGAAGLGAKVALIERHLMGGDCLAVGCVPSKGVISAARAWHAARTAIEFGGPQVSGEGDFATAMKRMRRLRAGISPHDSAARFRDLGIDVFIGEGRFVGANEVEVDGKRLRFHRAVIATGGRAAAPPIPGLDTVDYLTNETVFSLTSLPRRFGIIGAGPIGCEMSQAFTRLGSHVSLFEMTEHVLPREDPDAAAIVQGSMRADGVDLQLNVKVTAVERRGDDTVVHFERGGKPHELAFDELLIAVGRAPNVDNLGLEEAGVTYERSGVLVDDRLRTTNAKVYACGDVASTYKFTHMADAQARIVIQNALFFGRRRSSDLVVPWCTYTSPEIAHVGMYADDARELGLETDTLTVPLSGVDRAVLDGEDEGFLRVHLKKGSDKILGATLVAAHAGDMIGELCLAITAGVGLGKISATIHPYPTQAEVIKQAADQWRRTKLTPTVKKLFELWFRVFS
jgi:pyruvate/2-oxoglutarate dehydrogenase complex dihydrolipoamide dehydrogenase (E3) component